MWPFRKRAISKEEIGTLLAHMCITWFQENRLRNLRNKQGLEIRPDDELAFDSESLIFEMFIITYNTRPRGLSSAHLDAFHHAVYEGLVEGGFPRGRLRNLEERC